MVTVVGRCKRETEEKMVRRVVELAREIPRLQRSPFDREAQKTRKDQLCREKVHQLLLAHGIGSPKKHRGIKHRSHRERRVSEGMMLQVDGSPHMTGSKAKDHGFV